MAIDDNTSYELTGAQVKDLASRIKKGANLESLSNYVDATTFMVTDLQGLTAAINSGKAFYWNDPTGTGMLPDAYFNANITGNTIEISSIPDFIFTGGGNGALVNYTFSADATTGMFTGMTANQLPLAGTVDQMGNITFGPEPLENLTFWTEDGIFDYNGSSSLTISVPSAVKHYYITATSFAVSDVISIYKNQLGDVVTGGDIETAFESGGLVLHSAKWFGSTWVESNETRFDVLASYHDSQNQTAYLVFNYYDSTAGTNSVVKLSTNYTIDGGGDTVWDNTWTVDSVTPLGGAVLYSSLGENTDGAMTQKAVREALYDDADLKKIKIGSKQFSSDIIGSFSVGIGKSVIQSGIESVAIGRWAEARGDYSVAIGSNASTANNTPGVAIGYHAATNRAGTFTHAVALGDYAGPTRNYEVNIGTGTQAGYDGANDHTRVLGGVHAGILGTDAVNVDQLTAAIPGVFTGTDGTAAGTSGLVPAPTTADGNKYLKGDGTWGEVSSGLTELSYGVSTWNDFITAYQAKDIVYCRASSNANPATGTQTRKAFMAYVNNYENPTEVEFQYVRSVSSKTVSQPVDQVFVYKLTSASGGTWTVESRNMAPKLAAGTNTSVSYSNGTYTVSATDTTYSNMTGATSSAAGAAGLVPAPAAGDQGKFLKGDGTWAVVQSGPTVVQTTGQSTTDVMSQKAVTDIIGNVETILQTLNSGNGAQ